MTKIDAHWMTVPRLPVGRAGAPCEELATTEARLSCCQAAMDADQLTETWCVEALQQVSGAGWQPMHGLRCIGATCNRNEVCASE